MVLLACLALVLSFLAPTTPVGAGGAGPSTSGAPPPAMPNPASEHVPYQVLVKYHRGVPDSVRSSLSRSLGLRVVGGVYGAPDLELVVLPPGFTVEATIRALEQTGMVEYAEPNYVYYPLTAPPNDPRWSEQWGLENLSSGVDIDILNAWEFTQGSSGVIVAVIDSWVDINHPDLRDRIWQNPGEIPGDGVDNDGNGLVDDVFGWDFVANNGLYKGTIEAVHGTQVAGIIAATANNSVGIAGVAPQVTIMPLVVIQDGRANDVYIAGAINYAREQGVRIINASLGGYGRTQVLTEAVDAFVAAGGIIVAGAGNCGSNTDVRPIFPASLPNVVSVTSVTEQGQHLFNYGANTVALAAPGSEILSTFPRPEELPWAAGVTVAGDAYRAVLWGFCATDFTDAGARLDAIARAVDFLELPPDATVLLMDDDGNLEYRPDAAVVYRDSLRALGLEVDVWEVGYGDPGPGLDYLLGYDLVVWVSGIDMGWRPDYTRSGVLTAADVANLEAFLAAGKKLFLSGNWITYANYNAALLRDYLHTEVVVLDSTSTRNWTWAAKHGGLRGTGGVFVGADYTGKWQGSEFARYEFYRATSSQATEVLTYTDGDYVRAYHTHGGTSLAAPHVTGVVALLWSAAPEASAEQVLDAIMSTVTPLPSLQGKTITGGLVHAPRALAKVLGYGLQLNPGNLEVTEGGDPSAYTVALAAPPAGDVTVTISTDGQVAVSPESLLFTADNWHLPQAVTVTAVDDDAFEGLHYSMLTHQTSGGRYQYVPPVDLPVVVIDDEAFVVVALGAPIALAEGDGSTGVYWVSLAACPDGAVTVTPVSDGQVHLSPAGLEFTPENWNVPQPVTVEAVDDAVVEGYHTSTITHHASAGPYAGIGIAEVVVGISDNDTGSVTLTDPLGPVVEDGATTTYTVVLDRQPAGDVLIVIDAGYELLVGPEAYQSPFTMLVFTPDNWAEPQVVTVAGNYDWVVEGDHHGTITHTAVGGGYTGVSIPSVTVDIIDFCAPRFELRDIAALPLEVSEDGLTATYSVDLFLRPTTEVTITITGDPFLLLNGETTTQLVFTPENYNLRQTVTVSAVPDRRLGDRMVYVIHTASSPDGLWDQAGPWELPVKVINTEQPAVTVTPLLLDMAEGGGFATYTVALDLQPTWDVYVTVATDSQVRVWGDHEGTYLFRPEAWDQPLVMQVGVVDDPYVEGPHTAVITHYVWGGGYDGVEAPDVSVQISDNDLPLVTVTESDGSTVVSEDGLSDGYTVVLGAPPAPGVEVTITALAGGQVLVNGAHEATLAFTSANWNLPQVVAVAAVDDELPEGNHSAVITHTAAGGGYEGAPVRDVVVTVLDNDGLSLAITESDGSTLVEEGGPSDSYLVALSRQPDADVTITAQADDQVRVNGAASVVLVFTPDDWDVPQLLTVTAVDDAVVEGQHHGTVIHIAGGGNGDDLILASVDVTIIDNDRPFLVITEPDGFTEVVEGGREAFYQVALGAQPCGPVTVTVAPGDEQVWVNGSSTATLVFTPENWSIPQDVEVIADDDGEVEGYHSESIAHRATGGGYDGMEPVTLRVFVVDDDGRTVTLMVPAGSLRVAEGGAAGSYRVALGAAPTGEVTVVVAADNRCW